MNSNAQFPQADNLELVYKVFIDMEDDMDDKYIKIRKDFLWKGLVILIILLLAGLLVFQICTRINDKKEADYNHFNLVRF